MSIVHDMLTAAENRQAENGSLWIPDTIERKPSPVTRDMPKEIVNDFYDLKEHIRLSNLRDDVRVISVADSSQGEGSSSIATYLAFLLAGGMVNSLERSGAAETAPKSVNSKPRDYSESDKLFTSSFNSLNHDATTSNVFKGWRDSIDSRYIDVDNRDCTLLIDANIHQPRIHRYFGLDVENGLAEIVENGNDWTGLAKPVRDSYLKIITAGIAKHNPVEVLSSDRFVSLVREWRTAFRYVILDSPAILTHVDALSLAAAADGVVLVVRAGHTRWDNAQNAKRKLTAAQANLIGVTLNQRKLDIPDGLYRRLI